MWRQLGRDRPVRDWEWDNEGKLINQESEIKIFTNCFPCFCFQLNYSYKEQFIGVIINLAREPLPDTKEPGVDKAIMYDITVDPFTEIQR